jgi:DNA-binding protein
MADKEEQKTLEEANRKQPEKQQKKTLNEGEVFVGKKPTMNYVLAAMASLTDSKGVVKIKSRGRSISKAVDVAEVVRKRFVQGLSYDIEIDTEEMDDKGKKLKVSTICITLSKEKKHGIKGKEGEESQAIL